MNWQRHWWKSILVFERKNQLKRMILYLSWRIWMKFLNSGRSIKYFVIRVSEHVCARRIPSLSCRIRYFVSRCCTSVRELCYTIRIEVRVRFHDEGCFFGTIDVQHISALSCMHRINPYWCIIRARMYDTRNLGVVLNQITS